MLSPAVLELRLGVERPPRRRGEIGLRLLLGASAEGEKEQQGGGTKNLHYGLQ